jgi:hypothetical protein
LPQAASPETFGYTVIKNTNFTSSLYRCGTWSLILREKHRFRVSENRVLRIIFGPEREEVVRDWIMRRCITCKLHQILFG